MRVIMLIEVADRSAMDTIYAHLEDGVNAGRVDTYLTLCVDGESKARLLPPYMAREKNLSDWIAPFERINMGDRDPITGVEYGTLS
jgi:hypothetical protein